MLISHVTKLLFLKTVFKIKYTQLIKLLRPVFSLFYVSLLNYLLWLFQLRT